MNLLKTKKSRYLFCLALTLCFVFSGNSQTLSTATASQPSKPNMDEPDKNQIYSVIDKMPQYPGGEGALLAYIGKNLRYPISAQEKGIQGRIIIRFVVTKTGKVDNVEIFRGLDPDMDKEGLRVVSSLPDFIPGVQKGENVSVYYTLPITFKLQGDSKPKAFDPTKMPVIVLDEKVLPKNYDMNSIKKENIESVNVLKPDTKIKRTELIAKYGEGAVNGVVLITSKK